MIHIQAISVGPIDTNCYILHNDPGEAVVIDPGYQSEPILEAISHLKVIRILLTHAHWDHIAGVDAVHRHTGAPVSVHATEVPWLSDPDKNLSVHSPVGPVTVTAPCDPLHTDDTLHLLGEDVKVLATPGHSPGHVSFLMGDVIFGGDVLFMGSVGRTDLPGGDQATLLDSIQKHLLPLPDETTVLPGHGPVTTIGREKEHNPFL